MLFTRFEKDLVIEIYRQQPLACSCHKILILFSHAHTHSNAVTQLLNVIHLDWY